MRGLFGSLSSERASKLLGVHVDTLWRWCDGSRSLPGYAIARLLEHWQSAKRYRAAEIAARRREFDAIIVQEEQLAAAADRSRDWFLLRQTPAPGVMQSSRARYHRRRQEAALRQAQAPLADMFATPPAQKESPASLPGPLASDCRSK